LDHHDLLEALQADLPRQPDLGHAPGRQMPDQRVLAELLRQDRIQHFARFDHAHTNEHVYQTSQHVEIIISNTNMPRQPTCAGAHISRDAASTVRTRSTYQMTASRLTHRTRQSGQTRSTHLGATPNDSLDDEPPYPHRPLATTPLTAGVQHC